MFLISNKLNEGCRDEIRAEIQKRALCQGDNPKSELIFTSCHGKISQKPLTHVNSIWQKLRK